MQIIDYLDLGARPDPTADCIVDEDHGSFTYAEAQAFTHRVAAALHRDGFNAGERVTVLSPNRGDAFLTLLGGLRAQLLWFPVNPRFTPTEIAGLLAQFRCDILFVDEMFLPAIEQICAAAPSIRKVVSLDAGSPQVISLADWLAPEGSRYDPLPRGGEDLAAVIPTGGTTGASKGVLQSNRGFEAYTSQHMLAMPHDEPPRFLAATPMTHAAGAMAFPMLARGGTVFVQKSAKPLDVAEALQKHAITDIFLPPTVIYMLLADPEVRSLSFPSLKYLLYGAAPMSSAKLREALEWLGPVLVQGYGQTEAIAICTVMSPQCHYVDGDPAGAIADDHRLASAGKATPLNFVEIMDAEGRLLGDMERGEIVVRSSLVMSGYDGDEEATRNSRAFGWHHTGDIGYRDPDGYFYVVDRVRDMIISGGLNIFPSEIEQVLWAHPAIKDCAVVGAPDEKWGEIVTAVIEPKPGAVIDAAEILAYCRDHLSSIKVPKSVLIWPELPRSPIGKVLKRAVRDELWGSRTRRV